MKLRCVRRHYLACNGWPARFFSLSLFFLFLVRFPAPAPVPTESDTHYPGWGERRVGGLWCMSRILKPERHAQIVKTAEGTTKTT